MVCDTVAQFILYLKSVNFLVPLPDPSSRKHLIQHLLAAHKHHISSKDMEKIVKATEGYSGSDLQALCKDAALGPIRELGAHITEAHISDIRGINSSDFHVALERVRASVSPATLDELALWNKTFGVAAGS